MKAFRFVAALLIVSGICVTQLSAQTQTNTCTGKDQALETLGATGGMMIYNTFLVIGTIADGNTKAVYEDQFAIDLLDEQIAAINLLDTQYTELYKSGFITDASDKKFIEDVIKALHLLKNEATHLKRYISYDLDSDLDEYNAARNSAWDLIKEILGIEED